MARRTAPLTSIIESAKQLVQDDLSLLQELERLDKRVKENTFKLAVVALVKCGKSTINNAFIGSQYLPANAVPETSALTSILHNPSLKEPVLRVYETRAELARTSLDVLAKITSINKSIRDGNLEDTSYKKLLLETNVTALQGTSLENDVQFEIVDSPGNNEAKISQEVSKSVENLLAEADVVLYLFDYTKLGTIEDKAFIDEIGNLRPDIIANMKDRAFFVINKIDVASESESFQPEQAPEYLIRFLSKVPALKGLTVTSDRVFCISARQALWGRMLKNRTISAAVLQDAKKDYYGKKKASKKPDEAMYSKADEFLKDSNFIKLEKCVLTDMASHSFQMLIEGVRYDLISILNQVIRSTGENIQLLKEGKKSHERVIKDINAAKQTLEIIIKEIQGLLPNAKNASFETVDGFIDDLENATVKNLYTNQYNYTGKFNDELQAKQAAHTISNELFSKFAQEFRSLKPVVELQLYEDQKVLAKKAQDLVEMGVTSITTKLSAQLFPGLVFPPVTTKVKFSKGQMSFLNPSVILDKFVKSTTEQVTEQKHAFEEYKYEKSIFVEDWDSEKLNSAERLVRGLLTLGIREFYYENPDQKSVWKKVEKKREVPKLRPTIVEVTHEKKSWEVDGNSIRDSVLDSLKTVVINLENWYKTCVETTLTTLIDEAVAALDAQVTRIFDRFAQELRQLDSSVEEQKKRIESLEKIYVEAKLLLEKEKTLVIAPTTNELIESDTPNAPHTEPTEESEL